MKYGRRRCVNVWWRVLGLEAYGVLSVHPIGSHGSAGGAHALNVSAPSADPRHVARNLLAGNVLMAGHEGKQLTEGDAKSKY